MADLDQTGVEYGGVFRRLGAAILDLIIVTVLMGAIGMALGVGSLLGGASQIGALGGDPAALSESALAGLGAGMGAKTMWSAMLMVAIGILYFIVPLALPMRGTPGKLILGLAVTDRGHDRIGIGRAIWRYIAFTLSTAIFIGPLLAFFNKERRTLHDMMAGTVVVRKDSAPATIPERSMLGKIGNAVAALVCAAAIGIPAFGYVTGAGSSLLESGMNVAGNASAKTNALAKVTSQTATKRLPAAAGKTSKAAGDIDFTSADKVAERFEDMAVANQVFPKSPADLKLTSSDYNKYGIRGVAFDPQGAMLLKFAKGTRKATLRMLPSVDADSGYIAWKCSGAPANKLPGVCS